MIRRFTRSRSRVFALGIVLVVVALLLWSSIKPGMVLSRSLRTAEVTTWGLHQMVPEYGSTTFIFVIEVDNPTDTTVTVADISAEVLVDGNAYAFTELNDDVGTLVKPGRSLEFQRLIKIDGSPLGLDDEKHNITVRFRIDGVVRYLFFESEGVYKLEFQRDWTYVSLD